MPPKVHSPAKARTQQARAGLTEQHETRVSGADPLKLHAQHLPHLESGGSILGRGSRGLQQALAQPQLVSGPGPKPTSGPLAVATLPEWCVYWALTRLGKQEGTDFLYRRSRQFDAGLSGKTQLDFTLLDGSQIAIEIQGVFWHYGKGTAKQLADLTRRALLAPVWTVINIDEPDAIAAPLYYTQEALRGVDHSYRYKNFFVKTQGGLQ